jgi:flagellar biosynthesis/type III secretory pathway chaperone
MQEHLDRVDAALAQLVEATAALVAKVAEKEQKVALMTKQARAFNANAVDLQQKMPAMRQTCEGLKDV